MYAHGDILQRPLSGHMGKLYRHVGIYIGKGRVIHFNGTAFGHYHKAVIETAALADFADGQPVSRLLEPVHKGHGRHMVRLARQLKRQQNNPYNHRYHFLFRNCEDFCRYCYRMALDSETATELPPSQREATLKRLSKVVSMGYTGAKIGRLAGPYGAVAGAVAGGLAGALWQSRHRSRPESPSQGLPSPTLTTMD